MYSMSEILIGASITLAVIAVLALILSRCFPLYETGDNDE